MYRKCISLVLMMLLLLVGSAYGAPAVTNGGFETPNVTGYQYDPVGSSWTAAVPGYYVIADSGSAFGNTAYAGSQNGILQRVETISQSVSGFEVGKKYRVTWAEADRADPYGGNTLRVLIDDTVVGSLHTVTNDAWVVQTSDVFTATSTTHTIKFDATNTQGGDRSVFLDSISVAEALPSYKAAGAVVSGTGAITPAWPTHAAGDVALLVVESANQAISLSTPAGFAEVTNSPQGTGTAGGTAATRLAVYWKRATTSAESSPVVADSGNHQIARIITFRDVIDTGNPWDVTAGNVASSASKSVSIPGATTTVANALVVTIVANATDTTSARTSGWTNANLTGLTEYVDNNTNQGNGGGFGVAAGLKAAAGAYGTTTATLATSSVQGRMSIAMKPAVSGPGAASNPSPANGATSVSLTADLSWTAGAGATSHNVYFGTTSPGASQGNQTATTFDTGTMAVGTTYYWRIDEVNASGTTTGTVWSFTTGSAPGAASSPSPANGATSVGVTTDLSWTAGSGATSHNVYFGTTSPGTSRGNQTATTYDTGTMPNNTVHYWRIDEVNAYGTTTGTVWSFTTVVVAPGAASNPSPANGATSVSLTADLSWTAGSGATSHNVYFGTTSPGTSRGNQTATTYDTGTMPAGTVHYWRIDEVNAGGTTTGTVWSFTTGVVPGAASSPSPANGATSVSLTADLSWTAGSGATSHNVYFGTTSPGTSRGNQTATTYDTGTMPAGTVHYWRIDEVNAYGTTTGTVWSFTTGAVPGTAGSPSPANGATSVSLTADLSWTAGSGATSHNVYFGTTSPGTYQGNQTATTYDTGTMANSTTYYWRIDEVNAYGTTTGTVWSFTTIVTAPGAASNPSPANGATSVGVTTDLSWTAGSGAASHNVYFGTTSPGASQGNQTATTFDTGTMANSTTYYWRIDEVNAGGTTTGTVWSFTTVAGGSAPGAASGPSPANGATSVAVTTDLSWTAGSGATSHNVYFGTSSPGTYRGNQTATTYDTGTMPNNTVHYWRIDEVNAYGTTTGTVWSFTTIIAAPGAASGPSPSNGATSVSLTADLSWTAGSGAASHDVYFGMTSPGTYQGNQTATTFDTGTMIAGTTYYWRIDEINAGGTTTGTVWNFTTGSVPAAASSPSPSNGATAVAVTTDLSWTSGSGATSHNVYFGTTSPGASQGNQTATTFDTGTMSTSTTYYWRIDEVNTYGTTTGTVWNFTTAGAGAATSIGINLGSNETSLSSGDVAGVTVSQNNWNNASGSSGSLSNANNNNGVATTLDASWSANTTWRVTANGTSTGDAKLMYGYIDPINPGQTAVVNLTQIPYTTYNVYVYFGSNNTGATGTVTDGTTTYSFTNGANNPGGNGFQAADYVRTTDTGSGYPLANYAVFENRTGASRTITVTDVSSGSGIFGVQVTEVLVPVPGSASNPSPVNGATGVDVSTDLSWVAGSGATSHNVYFGTSSPGTYQGNQTATTFDTGTMASSTTYYWRIDEVNAYGTTTGNVWSFTTMAVAADLYSDTWVAVDALGRALPDYDDCGGPRSNRYVALFYFMWLGEHGTGGPYDITQLLAANPTNPSWGPQGAYHHWGQSELGYYLSDDEYVMYKHAYMLANAGVDVIVFDITNGYTYTDNYMLLCSVFADIRAAGGTTPQIAFMANAYADDAVTNIYNTLYSQGLYSDLWFYWKGKPLVLAPLNGMVVGGRTITYSSTIQNFFNMRYAWTWMDPGYDIWKWMDFYPQQYGWHESSSIPEELSVSAGIVPHGSGWGRSFHNGSQPSHDQYGLTGTENQGLCFAEQWSRLDTIDPEFLFITGWNEWVAQRQVFTGSGDPVTHFIGEALSPGDTWFIDTYNAEFSRDIEPMKNGYTDNYYYQMIDGIRRYKGVRQLPAASAATAITIDGSFTDWNGVSPEYGDWIGDTLSRNSTGWGSAGTYTNTTGRNDFVVAKVARDASYIYFYMETDENITSYTGSNWMMLFINSDQSYSDGWKGYDYVVNMGVTSSTVTTLKGTSSGWNWTNVNTNIAYQVSGNKMEIRVPRSDIGQSGSTVAFDFHWSDNIQANDDIIQFAISGDSAPDRRFNYRYEATDSGSAPGAASNPSPANGATSVSTTADLSWTAGSGATSHNVYFGTDSTPDSGEYKGNQSGTTYDTGTMSNSTTYYWRIDEVNTYGTTTGTVWSFTTVAGGSAPGAASNPSPASGASNIAVSADLSWTAGSGATSHNVYFGTDSTPDSGELKGNQSGTSYDPGTMAESTIYYWRIDEVNTYGTTTGTVWNFTTIGQEQTTAVAYWPLNETSGSIAYDAVGSVDGTLHNMDSSDWVSGYIGGALDFDGSNDYVSMARSSVIETGNASTHQLSASAWIKHDLTSPPTIFTAIVGTGDGGWFIGSFPNENKLYFACWLENGGSGETAVITDNTPVFNGQWHHVAAVYDGSKAHLYVDGNHAEVSTIGGTVRNMSNLAVLLAENGGATGRYWDGRIDDVKIYDYALSSEEVYHMINPTYSWNPSPASGASGVVLNSTLSWSAGTGATSHDVYFGQDSTPDSGEFVGNQTSATYSPGVLTASTTYYWRIDEVNAGGTVTGRVWSFTTGTMSNLYGIVFPGTSWATKTPAELGLDGSKLDQLASNIGGQGIIVRQGYVVKTWGSQSSKDDWASAAKPVTSTLLFFAIEENLLDDVYELIGNHGWSMSGKDQTMNFFHLANMTGGYMRPESPGAAWAYNDYAICLYVKTLFDHVYNQDPDTVARSSSRLGALGFEDGSIYTTRADGYGITTSPRDFARIGWLWCNKGYWNGQQLLPRWYFDTYMKAQVPSSTPRTSGSQGSDYLGVGTVGGGTDQTSDGPGVYGFNWWCNDDVVNWPDAPADTVQGNGHWGEEVVTVIPSLSLVVAYRGGDGRSHSTGSSSSEMNQDLKLLVEACPEYPLGQIIVDPSHSNRMVYRDVYENGRQKPVCFAGPGDPEDFFWNNTTNNLNLLTGRGARCTYITAVLQDFGGPFNPGTGTALDTKLTEWEGYITQLENAGVITVFFFFDDTQPLTSNWEELVDKCVAKFKHHKLLIWSVAEEYGEALTTAQVSAVAARIKAQDNYNHVVGVHQNHGNTFDFMSDSNINMFLMQLNGYTAGDLHNAVKNSNANGSKILNMAEAENHASQSRTDVRKWNWAAAMGGASAVQVLYMGRASDPADYNTVDKYNDCARLMDFMESTRLNETVNYDSLARGNTDYVLANPGQVYIVYGDSGSSLGVNVSAGTYSVIWYDPADGDWVDQGNQSLSAGDQTFTKPGAIGDEAALYLERQGDYSGDVGRYAMFEKVITNTSSYSNAFTDTTLTATFTSPSAQQTVVYGFYDGGQTWKVRFMPNQLGQWSYVATFSDSAPGASGSFQCVSSSLHGPLEVNTTDDNSKQWFRHVDGTPFYMRSFHLWFVETLESQGHLTDTLDYLQGQGFNTINGPHLWPKSSGGAAARTLAPWQSTGYETWDFSRFDLTEWQRLDTVLTQLANRNMILVPFSIMLGTNGQPMIDTSANRDLFLRYWVARWGGFWNATFQPFSEWEEDYSESLVLEILNRIYELDGGRHLISVHPLYRGTSGVQNATAYSYHTIQDKLASNNDYMKYVNTFGGLYYYVKKPMLAHECLWEGNCYQGNVGLDMGQMRRGAWVIALSGGQINYADERVANYPYYQTAYFEDSFSVIGKAMNPLGQLYPYLDILGDFMESLPLAQMGQNSTISSTQTCLLTPGVRYVTYAPSGGSFTVNLTGTSGTFDGQWLNPRTGAWSSTFNVSGGDVRNVTAPDSDDWVLRLVHQ